MSVWEHWTDGTEFCRGESPFHPFFALILISQNPCESVFISVLLFLEQVQDPLELRIFRAIAAGSGSCLERMCPLNRLQFFSQPHH
jgi:hypothetical protein